MDTAVSATTTITVSILIKTKYDEYASYVSCEFD